MKKYRSLVHCDRCGWEYVTIKHIKEKPSNCKNPDCHSIMIRVLDSWEV